MNTNIICELVYSMEEVEARKCETEYDEFELIRREEVKIKNRGTGAGGSNTNKNGIKLEDKVREIISKNIEIIGTSAEYRCNEKCVWKVEDIIHNGKNYIRAPESAFKRFEGVEGINYDKADGAIEPDDLIVNKETKTISWIECKVQNGGGSVAEKLQTAGEKIINLERRFPGWKINYFYILSHYFKRCKATINRLDEQKILYIYDSDENLEGKIVEYAFNS